MSYTINRKRMRIAAVVVVCSMLATLLFAAKLTRPTLFSAKTEAAHANHSGPKVLYWYDPMHPSYRADKPGTAPDCGMDLVPMYEGAEGALEEGVVKVDAQRQQLLGVTTGKVEKKQLTRLLQASGLVTPDESRVAHVHVKVPGWVEDVRVNFVGQMVRKGQPLFTLYSPDLVASQEEYLIARRGEQALGGSSYADASAGANSLLRSARERLRLWDLTEKQIRDLDESGKVSRTLTFYSPVTGYVTERKVFPNTSVSPDVDLYSISDLTRLWIMADVYEYELPYVKVGQSASVRLTYAPDKPLKGKVGYIYPELDAQTHTAKVRIEVSNPNLTLKPNMFAEVELKIDYGKRLVVPSAAVLNSGKQQTVFVGTGDGRFEARQVVIGPQVEDQTIVMFGLEEGETIVTSGNFLIDSESRMKSAASAMQH